MHAGFCSCSAINHGYLQDISSSRQRIACDFRSAVHLSGRWQTARQGNLAVHEAEYTHVQAINTSHLHGSSGPCSTCGLQPSIRGGGGSKGRSDSMFSMMSEASPRRGRGGRIGRFGYMRSANSAFEYCSRLQHEWHGSLRPYRQHFLTLGFSFASEDTHSLLVVCLHWRAVA